MEELHKAPPKKKQKKIDEPYPNRCTPVTRQQSIRKRLKNERGGEAPCSTKPAGCAVTAREGEPAHLAAKRARDNARKEKILVPKLHGVIGTLCVHLGKFLGKKDCKVRYM
jgi:hypothetical protein